MNDYIFGILFEHTKHQQNQQPNQQQSLPQQAGLSIYSCQVVYKNGLHKASHFYLKFKIFAWQIPRKGFVFIWASL